MKRTHALIAVLALMSMTTVAQAAAFGSQGVQKQDRAPVFELAADAQATIPAQWREDRFDVGDTGVHGLWQQQQAATQDNMVPAQWREDRFDVGDTGVHGLWQQQQATMQDMIPAQWREDRFGAAGAGDNEFQKQG